MRAPAGAAGPKLMRYTVAMDKTIAIIGAGLAGTEAALQLASRGFGVSLYEMRPETGTPVHVTGRCAELVCSNSLKSTKPESAAGMLKAELAALDSFAYAAALETRVAAGGALAVDRDAFSLVLDGKVRRHPNIEVVEGEVESLGPISQSADAVVVASGPLTTDALAQELSSITGSDRLSFFDAAAPIVMADSIDYGKVFRQSRYEDGGEGADGQGDYLNAPFTREEYVEFAYALLEAERVIQRDFETKDLFQACQPIEEIMRKGIDAPRFGPLKPVGLTDPRTGRRPYAALQLRAENAEMTAYNLVGFQTNLRFAEQKRVFSMIPGLERAEFARFGVMHRNTFIDAPHLLDSNLALRGASLGGVPVYVAGQLGGTEGYCEAIRSGLHCALAIAARFRGIEPPALPAETAFGALLRYATDPQTEGYQPMHVNFGIMPPLSERVRNKGLRYAAYAKRGAEALAGYVRLLEAEGLMERGGC